MGPLGGCRRSTFVGYVPEACALKPCVVVALGESQPLKELSWSKWSSPDQVPTALNAVERS